MVKPQVTTDGTRTAVLTVRDRDALARATEVCLNIRIADGGTLGDEAEELARGISAFLAALPAQPKTE